MGKSYIFHFTISRKVKTQLKLYIYIYIYIHAVYGESAVIDQMCQKWLVKFPVGDFSLDGYPMRRPVVLDSNQIKTLIH